MPWIEANLEAVPLMLASVILVTDVLRRVMRGAARRRRVSRAAWKIRRGLGWLEVALICLLLVALIPPSIYSGSGLKPLKLPTEQWQASLQRCLSDIGACLGRSDVYRGLETARVTKVKDGDSLILRLSEGESIEARLHGVDAPEYSQPHGGSAKRALGRKVSFRKVGFEEVDVDSYGRRVIVLYRGDRNINAEMVCEGHAWWYRRYARRARDLEQCENAARSERIGLWQDEDPTPPWQWRRMQ